jgi:ABC-type multidrug transport system fused ATPase/permease subunit
MEIYKRLLLYLKPYRMRLLWAAVFMLLSSAMISAQTYLVKPVIDKVIIGGGMANTFFKAQGLAVGDSLVEAEALDTASELLKSAGDKLVLPVDCVIADRFAPRPSPKSCRWTKFPTAGAFSTSARPPWPTSPIAWRRPRPSSGTAPWASSSSRSLKRALKA